MMADVRRRTRQIRVGTVAVGGGVGGTSPAAVSIQTMAKADPRDVSAIVAQLREAQKSGCGIARIAVPDMDAVATLKKIKERIKMPLVADIHFDYRLAVASARAGADALRINPGNIGGGDALKATVEAAGEAGIPIRIGVNSGSLPKRAGKPAEPTAERMVATALAAVDSVHGMGFLELKVSLKASDVATTMRANRLFAAGSDVPLHVGVTEAGPPLSGAIRSVAALAPLLSEGIGDTLRISLTAPPALEVRVARILLVALGLRSGGVVVSCPTCGRVNADLAPVAERVEEILDALGLDISVAVMGCEVNGPGEARQADLGIAFGPRGEGLMFESGRVQGKHPNRELEAVLVTRLKEWAKEQEHER
jgi:(E)-4-hydroxy-3-methylbut-2-enyl-diphosphate synthase